MSVCVTCGLKNEPHYKFCLGCGNELPSSSALQAPISSGWVEDDNAAEPGAAAKVDPEEKVAISPSLLELTAPPTVRICPSCGASVVATFQFCGQCGGRMDGPSNTLLSIAPTGVTQGRLVLVRADGSEGATHELALGDNLIGRGKGPLFDSDGYLSPRHAQVSLLGDGVTITDSGSLNGTFLRIKDEEELFDGDVFRVGQELLRFQLLPPAEPLEDGTHIMGSPPGSAWGRLVLIVSRDQEGSAFPIGGEGAVLGRERGDILFAEDGYVSGTHARVSTRGGRYFLADLNSSNGTFVRLRGPRQVPTGALLLMGQQLFRVIY